MNHRTRIKICGLTRKEDVASAVALGADAIGLVFYANSARHVTAQAARELVANLPPFVQVVGLFVNASASEVADVVRQVPLSLLQFHGDETLAACCQVADAVQRPFIRAERVGPDTLPENLLQSQHNYRTASRWFSGLLLDTLVDGYGGSGKVFDWSVIPKELAPLVVLSGGLSAHNVTGAVHQVRPWALDISSGVELAKGIKDAAKIHAFIAAVRQAEANFPI